MTTDMEDDTITFYARQQIWQQYAVTYQRKCLYPWCNRIMNQDNFCVIFYDNANAWDITSINNMRPVCDVCYASMRRPTMREWVDYMDYSYSMEALRAPIPPSHGEGMNSHPDGYVLPSHPSFSDPSNDMES